MKDIYFHNENLCSIAQINNTFSGKYIIRDILNIVLRQTFLIIGEIQRPYYEVKLSVNSVSSLSSELESLSIAEDFFSLSFKYFTKANNDSFIESFQHIWFEYEQPAFAFFVKGLELDVYKNLNISKRTYWSDITLLSPCYVLFKGIEEDVMWVGKTDNLTFDGLFL